MKGTAYLEGGTARAKARRQETAGRKADGGLRLEGRNRERPEGEKPLLSWGVRLGGSDFILGAPGIRESGEEA